MSTLVIFPNFFFVPSVISRRESLYLCQCRYNARMGSLFADLSKHKRYEIRLSVYNAVGEGPISAPQEVFVGEAGRCLFTLISRSGSVSLITYFLVT